MGITEQEFSVRRKVGMFDEIFAAIDIDQSSRIELEEFLTYMTEGEDKNK
jgi:hypothetical protein